MPSGKGYAHIRELKKSKALHTVCEEAACPNIGECWESGNATFLILGDVCTRDCRFCAVKGGRPSEADWREPVRVAEAAAAMGLRHAVVTSVTRDDLFDGGAEIFAETIRQIREHVPTATVEVLIPDFRGDPQALETVMKARPDILGHNVETVPRLYASVRPQAQYARSLGVLRAAKGLQRDAVTKSGIMVGLGETKDEIAAVMKDLRAVNCDILTLGQYLRPSLRHLPVIRYYAPEEFEELKQAGDSAGFDWVEAGPLVRSSYHAESQARSFSSRSRVRGKVIPTQIVSPGQVEDRRTS